MAKPESVFIFIGTYPDKASAQADYQVVKDLHSAGVVGTYDAAVVTKDYDGKVHENKDEMPTRHGAWGGAAVGAAIGILFPPALIGTAAVGAAVGGVGAHLWRGMSRADVKELGEVIDDGQAALLVVGESKLQQAVRKAVTRAEKQAAKDLDVSPGDIDAAIQQAARDLSLPVPGRTAGDAGGGATITTTTPAITRHVPARRALRLQPHSWCTPSGPGQFLLAWRLGGVIRPYWAKRPGGRGAAV